jgi:hypothetical protein
MTRDEIREEARRVPFRPFRIVLTTGEMYDIRHPDLIMVGLRSVEIGLTYDPEGTAYERIVRADLFHIVRVEELPAGPASTRGMGT